MGEGDQAIGEAGSPKRRVVLVEAWAKKTEKTDPQAFITGLIRPLRAL